MSKKIEPTIEKTTLVKLLKLLDADERQRFTKYVIFKLCNNKSLIKENRIEISRLNKKRTIQLLKLLKLESARPKYQLTEQFIFEEIFKENRSRAKRDLYTILGECEGYFEAFMTTQLVIKEDYQGTYYPFLHFLNDKSKALFVEKLKEAEKQVQNLPPIKNFEHQLELVELTISNQIRNTGKANLDLFKEKNELVRHQMDYKTLVNYCSVKSTYPSEPWKPSQLTSVLERLKTTSDSPEVIKLWHSATLLLRGEGKGQDKKLAKLASDFLASDFLEKEEKLLEARKGEVRQIYQILINHYIRAANWQAIFEIYQTIFIDNKAIFIEGKFRSYKDFKNIVRIAIRVNELAYAEEFIKDHKDKIDRLSGKKTKRGSVEKEQKQEKEDIINFCDASLYFAQKKYEECYQKVQLLSQLKPGHQSKDDGILNKFLIRILRIKAIFELTHSAETQKNSATKSFDVEKALNSFEAFVRKAFREKKIDANQKEKYFNFIGILIKIEKFNRSATRRERKKASQSIQEQLESITNIEEKEWLGQKIEDLN